MAILGRMTAAKNGYAGFALPGDLRERMTTVKYDLRSALDQLEQMPGQVAYLRQSVDPSTEITGLYQQMISAAARRGQVPPALICTNLKGFPNKRLVLGVNSRGRIARLLGCGGEELGTKLLEALKAPIQPIYGEEGRWDNVRLADDSEFDIRDILPAPKNTPGDAGPFITMGMCCASDPETGERDVTIHRICLQSRDEMTISFAPGRHIDVFRAKAERQGESLPISISIGYDPVIAMASCFQAPVTPLGFNELSIAGALRGEPVELTRCRTIPEYAIAGSELVIEGEVLPGVRMPEDSNTHTGFAMPEFTGYQGVAETALPVIKVKAVTFRDEPIIQSCIGSSFEHVTMAGPPMEACIWKAVNEAMPGKVTGVYAPPFGGGKLAVVLRIRKCCDRDEGVQRQAALVAFGAFRELKHVFLVDDDVDHTNLNDVLWAMTTRFQGDLDAVPIPGVRIHHIDPSSWPEYSPFSRVRGEGCKMIFDCTVPYAQKDRFFRARFEPVRLEDYKLEPCGVF